MRLNQREIDAIKAVVIEICGDRAVVRLFGSRLDDSAKGGDIDLMVELDEAVDHPARLSAWLSVKVMRATQGRKVDVILAAPNLEELPIHRIGREQGVILSHE
ncbi:nucleotidyltransferase domain-containing protein [Halomonas sp. JS92-SW72]|uniref:nucleotidyltransferase domain-containing protein n=1 Tax=Halomonas sp. JS92-SW72 TaxID=2306583 RepID=UPI000E5A64E2|nr:nucleotidyltransferase domain-containing protein [Halomonas sp. JS92-SW72]AXY40721.1 nucleotidyltransferase domain-containing protein [Halomonas sp. JS92-SW72]